MVSPMTYLENQLVTTHTRTNSYGLDLDVCWSLPFYYAKVWRWTRKMQRCRQCSQHICSCRRKGFSAHGLTLSLDPGILLRVCIILVKNYINWLVRNNNVFLIPGTHLIDQMRRLSFGFFSLVNTPLSMRRHNMLLPNWEVWFLFSNFVWS